MSERWDITGTDRRILDQYKSSPNLIALFKALIDEPSGELRAAFEQLLPRLNIDLMEGVQLDLIGDIIGRPRPGPLDPIFVQDSGFFEFRDVLDANDPELGFDALVGVGDDTFTMIGLDGGEPDEPSSTRRGFGSTTEEIGGLFKTLEGIIMPEPVSRNFEGAPFRGIDPSLRMDDPDYRELLKAVIFLNTSGATVPELEFYGSFVLGVTVTIVNGFTAIDLEFAKRLTVQERAIIDATLLPAAGIRIGNVKIANGEGAFGFSGNPNNTGFGAVGEDQTGAGFARVAA
jgi:hypothetical protein